MPKRYESQYYFNPRSREGSDRRSWSKAAGSCISIHAPAKGATQAVRSGAAHAEFQSTLPRRERHSSCSSLNFPSQFQSTLPRRERQVILSPADVVPLFQSTLPRRERPGAGQARQLPSDFNPRSREGSDQCSSKPLYRWHYFNPRSREGSDITQQREFVGFQQFQSTLPRRERRKNGSTS